MGNSCKLHHLDVNTAVLLNERLYEHKEAIRILTPLTSSGNVITLCMDIAFIFKYFILPEPAPLSFWPGLLPCTHFIFILTLNAISSWEIRHQPSSPLLFEPRSEDWLRPRYHSLSFLPSSHSHLCYYLSLFPSIYPFYLHSYLSTPAQPHLWGLTSYSRLTYHLH